MEILWGTASPIQVRDPVQMIMTSLRARGAFKVSVCNGQTFLSKLVGNNVDFLTQEGITQFFRNEMMTHIKSQIAKYIKESNEEILGICSEQEELSQKLTPVLSGIFEEYGVKLLNFSISSIDIPENDPNRQKLEAAYSTKRESQIYGNDYQKFVAREVVTNLSKNDNAAGIAVMGAGLNAASGVGNMFASAGSGLFNSATNSAQTTTTQNTDSGIKCGKCGVINNAGAKFCSECGSPLEAKKSFCTNCGAELAPGVKFCSGCGTKVGE
jgi:membrane protease subunit (stomatin/prohibitin family)